MIIDDTLKILSKLPSLGPRSARNILLHLLLNKDTTLNSLIHALEQLKSQTFECNICGNIDYKDPCSICSDSKVDQDVLCVVENISDLWAVERTHQYKGLYHVLSGTLRASKNQNPENTGLEKLKIRLDHTTFQEIILALSPTLDGQSTIFYILDIIPKGIKVTRPSYGIPLGSNLDFLDNGTIDAAFHHRLRIDQ